QAAHARRLGDRGRGAVLGERQARRDDLRAQRIAVADRALLGVVLPVVEVAVAVAAGDELARAPQDQPVVRRHHARRVPVGLGATVLRPLAVDVRLVAGAQVEHAERAVLAGEEQDPRLERVDRGAEAVAAPERAPVGPRDALAVARARRTDPLAVVLQATD